MSSPRSSTTSGPRSPTSPTSARSARCPTPRRKPGPGSTSPARLDAPNYDLEAAALGLWRPGQEDLTAAYAERYFAEVAGTAAVRQGWVLAESAGSSSRSPP